MSALEVIDIKQKILSDNDVCADEIRACLDKYGVFMLNLMASPGSGKTSLILETIQALQDKYNIAVVEGDIESTIDSEKIAALNIPAIQLRTGGACHIDAPMVNEALKTLDLSSLDLIFLENVGNLVCPAEFDTGANLCAMILSVPEGDDKVFKYPLMFSVCDALVINKMDVLDAFDFDVDALSKGVRKLNSDMEIFEVSCKTHSGIEQWSTWLASNIDKAKG